MDVTGVILGPRTEDDQIRMIVVSLSSHGLARQYCETIHDSGCFDFTVSPGSRVLKVSYLGDLRK